VASTRPHARIERISRHRTAAIRRPAGRTLTALLTALVTLLGLAVVGATGGAGVASAATPGVTTNLLLNGFPVYDGDPVVKSGDHVTLQVQYDNTVTPGSSVTIDMGPNVTVGTLPAGNTAVSSITKVDDQTVKITFADPFPPDVNQGALSLDFLVDNVATSKHDTLSWGVNGDTSTKDVIILAPGDSTENVTDGQAKALSGNYNGAVTVTNGVVSLNPTVIGKPMSYTLTASTTTANPAYPIADSLPGQMAYVAGSASATLTTWDAQGLNKATNPFAAFTPALNPSGNSFGTAAALPANSVLTVTYQAAIPDEPARAALQAQLQTAYDAVGASGGTFTVPLKNTATINGVDKSATVNLTGTKANEGVTPGTGQFDKTSDWSSQNVTPAADGTLSPAQPITYTFKVNLTAWDGTTAPKTLSQNVVVTDTLPAQVDWNTAAGFLSSPGMSLAAVSPCPADISTDAFVGRYCVAGKTLRINVGKDNTTNTTIDAVASITTIAGLTPTTSGSVKTYTVGNTASFTSSSAPAYTRTRTVSVVDRGDTTNGVDDPSVFTKTTAPSQVSVDPGQRATVVYTFTVNANKGVNAADVYLVDPVDTTVFDTSDLASIAAGITGQYGTTALVAGDFSVTKEPSGALRVELSAAGKAKASTPNLKWTVNLPLPTKPVVGKQTIAITNKATVFGDDNTPMYFSQASGGVSSYGDEAELRKDIRDTANDDWTTNLRAQLDADGNLIKSRYVYRVQFIPHGNYNNVTIIPVHDVLPAGTQFVGFVTEPNVDSAANPVTGPVDIGGNLQARYDTATKTMSLVQKPGTLLDSSQDIAAYFAVDVVDFKADVPIVNKIGPAAATITPTDGYPLTIAKQDSRNQSTVITDHASRFRLADANGKVVVDNIFVDNGFLRVAGTDGQPSAVKVGQPGTYTLSEVVPPAGYVRSTDTLQIVVGAAGVPAQQTFYDDPVGPSVSVGDYVWLDANRDGRQDQGEHGISGVVLTITGPNGAPVIGVNGLPVGPRTTDTDGAYSFDGLPVLQAGQHYTVTIDRVASKAALAPYVPTIAGQGDRVGDSSTWSAQSQGLTAGGQRDPTLDFGFVTKTYAVGDKVWIDTDKNGLQGPTEPPLAGVRVTLLDGSGAVVGTTTTDANGRYLFDDLPAGSYRVTFELTPDQAARYRFTTPNRGAAGTDSDADPSTGLTKTFVLDDTDANLTTDYSDQAVRATQGIDPTWDAGVVELAATGTSSSTDPTSGSRSSIAPTTDPDPASTTAVPVSSGPVRPLASTGIDVGGMMVAALFALLCGAALVIAGRRRRPRRMH
jgi:DNA-directed RNA polymerase II subunit RPB1